MNEYIKGSELKIGDFFRFSNNCTDLPHFFLDKILMFVRTSDPFDGEQIVGTGIDIDGNEVAVFNCDLVIPLSIIKSEEFE